MNKKQFNLIANEVLKNEKQVKAASKYYFEKVSALSVELEFFKSRTGLTKIHVNKIENLKSLIDKFNNLAG